MFKKIFIAFVIYTLLVYNIYTAQIKTIDPIKIKNLIANDIDNLVRKEIHDIGQMQSFESHACQVGTIYNLFYDSGFTVQVQYNEQYNDFTILKYKLDIKDIKKKQSIQSSCPKPGLVTPLENKYQSLNKTSQKSSLSTQLLTSKSKPLLQQKYQIQSNSVISLTNKNQQKKIEKTQKQAKSQVKTQKANEKVEKKQIIKNQQKKLQKAQKQVKQLVKTQKTAQKIVQKIIEQKQQKESTSKLNQDVNLQFKSVLPTDKQMTPYVGLAVDALKYQLKDQSNDIILLEVYQARKNTNIVVIKLVCHNTKKNTKFDFLFESSTTTQIKNIEQKKIIKEYESIPSEILQLPEFQTFMKKFLAENKAEKYKLNKVQWCKKDNRSIKFNLSDQKNKKDYQFQTKNQQIEEFFRQLEKKRAEATVNTQKLSNPIKEQRTIQNKKVKIGEQTVAVNTEKNYIQQKISKQDSPKITFAEKQQKITSKIEPKQIVSQYDLAQYEQIPIEVMSVKSFEDMIIRILSENKITQYKIQLISWKKNDNNDILIIMENDLKDKKYINTKITNCEGVFSVDKSQKQKIKQEVVKQNVIKKFVVDTVVNTKDKVLIAPEQQSQSKSVQKSSQQNKLVNEIFQKIDNDFTQGNKNHTKDDTGYKLVNLSQKDSKINIITDEKINKDKNEKQKIIEEIAKEKINKQSKIDSKDKVSIAIQSSSNLKNQSKTQKENKIVESSSKKLQKVIQNYSQSKNQQLKNNNKPLTSNNSIEKNLKPEVKNNEKQKAKEQEVTKLKVDNSSSKNLQKTENQNKNIEKIPKKYQNSIENVTSLNNQQSTDNKKISTPVNLNEKTQKLSQSKLQVIYNIVPKKDISSVSVSAPIKQIQNPKQAKPVLLNTQTKQIQTAKTQVKSSKQTIIQTPKKCQFKYEETPLNNLPFTNNDPQLLAFVTSKLQSDFSSSLVFNQMLDFIAQNKKFSPTSQFKVLLFNQMKFGVRFVLKELNSNKLFEAVVQFHQKTDNSYSFSLESWKELMSLHQISVNPFSVYNKLIEKDTDMENMLLKSLSKGTGLQNIKKLESVEKKVAPNGIYYKCIFNTKDNNQYLTQFLYNPEIDFSEILSYQDVNMPYDFKNEEDYAIPYDKDFIQVQNSLLKKFSNVLTNAQILYVRKSPVPNQNKSQNVANFRIILISHSGRFQVILSYDYDSKTIKIYRLQQLDQGFKIVGLSDRATKVNQDVISNARVYLGRLSSLLRPELAQSIKNQKINFNEQLIQMNDFDNYGQFTKIIYRQPIPVSFTIFEDKRIRKDFKDHHHHPVSLTSIDELPIYPTNPYYSDKLFNGYKQIYPSQLEYNKQFPILKQKANKDYSNILNRPNKIVGVFNKQVSDKSFFKIIYNVEDKDIYIGTCQYNPKGNLYQVLSVQKSQDLTIDGTYKENCQKFEKKSSLCITCKKGFVETAGRCYKKMTGCNVQIGQNCYLCDNGFVQGSDNLCYKNPEKVIDTSKNIVIVNKAQNKQVKIIQNAKIIPKIEIKQSKIIQTSKVVPKSQIKQSKLIQTQKNTLKAQIKQSKLAQTSKIIPKSQIKQSKEYQTSKIVPKNQHKKQPKNQIKQSNVIQISKIITPSKVHITQEDYKPEYSASSNLHLSSKSLKSFAETNSKQAGYAYQNSSKQIQSPNSLSNTYKTDKVVKKQYKQIPQTKTSSAYTTTRYSSNSYYDPNCLSYNGPVCVYCTYRHYLKDGVCRKVPDSCSSYEKSTGDCTHCYTGYYLAGGNCVERDPLCAQTNSRGQCVDCYKNYVLLDGKCYYRNNAQLRRDVQKDSLCQQYNQKTGKCLKCVQGSYLNNDGFCRIADPNCAQFNQKLAFCQKCIRGYQQVRGKCLRRNSYW